MSGSACEEGHYPFLQALNSCILGKHLSHRSHGKRSKYLGLHSHAAENLRHIDTVHHSCQHTNLVRFCTINIVAGTASPEIASSDHNSYLNTAVTHLLYLFCNLKAGCLIKSGMLLTGQSFSTQFQKYTFHIAPQFFLAARSIPACLISVVILP